jgi:hypothetical protein
MPKCILNSNLNGRGRPLPFFVNYAETLLTIVDILDIISMKKATRGK